MKSGQRHDLIRDIIKNNSIETQEQLKEHLEKVGINVTQATVSRDIKKMQLFKSVNSSGKYCYTAPVDNYSDEIAGDFFKSAIISIDYSLNNIVIKVKSGMAQATCATIDEKNIKDIIGTIAGDDTILLITKSEFASLKVVNELNNIFG